MHRTRLIGTAILALALSAVLGTACTKDNAGTPGTTGTTGTAPVRVSHIDLGREIAADKTISNRTETFKPNDTIYASVLTNGSAPNARIGVKWMYQDGQVVDQSEQVIAPNGSAATEFHITKPDGLPAGDYKVEVSVDGSPVQTKDFKVTAS